MSTLLVILLVVGVFLYISKGYKTYTDNYADQFKNFSISKSAVEQSELGLFVALTAKVAKADGRVDALEAELIGNMFTDVSRVFPEPDRTREILKQIFDEQKNSNDNVTILAGALKNLIKNDRNKQIQMMGFLIQLAFVDGEVSKAEEEILITIAETLAIDPKIYHGIFDQFESMMKNVQPQASIEDAYALLGVSPNDSMDTVKKAYRKLVRAYHPDIIKAQGRDENYIKEATEKTQEINAAYEMIKKARS